MLKDMIKKASLVKEADLYSSPSQRRWLWDRHPDIAVPLEAKQITVNQAVDIVNAREGLITHYSIDDYMQSPTSTTAFIPKRASIAGAFESGYGSAVRGLLNKGNSLASGVTSLLPGYNPGVHSVIQGLVSNPLTNALTGGLSGASQAWDHLNHHGIRHEPVISNMVAKAKLAIGIKPEPFIPEHYQLPLGVALGMAGAVGIKSVSRMVSPRSLIKGVSTDMLKEYVDTENEYYSQYPEQKGL